MADVTDESSRPPAALPEVPTKITAEQVIAFLLLVFVLSYAKGVLAPLTLAVLGSLALSPHWLH